MITAYNKLKKNNWYENVFPYCLVFLFKVSYSVQPKVWYMHIRCWWWSGGGSGGGDGDGDDDDSWIHVSKADDSMMN